MFLMYETVHHHTCIVGVGLSWKFLKLSFSHQSQLAQLYSVEWNCCRNIRVTVLRLYRFY